MRRENTIILIIVSSSSRRGKVLEREGVNFLYYIFLRTGSVDILSSYPKRWARAPSPPQFLDAHTHATHTHTDIHTYTYTQTNTVHAHTDTRWPVCTTQEGRSLSSASVCPPARRGLLRRLTRAFSPVAAGRPRSAHREVFTGARISNFHRRPNLQIPSNIIRRSSTLRCPWPCHLSGVLQRHLTCVMCRAISSYGSKYRMPSREMRVAGSHFAFLHFPDVLRNWWSVVDLLVCGDRRNKLLRRLNTRWWYLCFETVNLDDLSAACRPPA